MKKLSFTLSVLIVTGLLLTACGPAAAVQQRADNATAVAGTLTAQPTMTSALTSTPVPATSTQSPVPSNTPVPEIYCDSNELDAAAGVTFHVKAGSQAYITDRGLIFKVECSVTGMKSISQVVTSTPSNTPAAPQISATSTVTAGGTPDPAVAGTPLADCHDNSTTVLGARDPLKVNEAKTNVEVRDQGCMRDLFHAETGVAQGANYRLDIPKGWSLGIAAVSCQVAQDGKKPVDYKNGPFLVFQGPWHGSVGCYEAGLHGLPSEWESYLTTTILAIHRDEVGNQALEPIFLP